MAGVGVVRTQRESNAGAAFWTPANLAHVTGGAWLREPRNPDAPLAGVGTDSRAVAKDSVFIAIPGEKFDGHDYVPQALSSGAAMAIVSKDGGWPMGDGGWGILQVGDTIGALQQLARAYRDALRVGGCRVIAITGSNGKTTTRNLIHTVLSAGHTGTQSPKSFNNHLGVPLTLLAARPEHDFVVVEIGSNHPGEVAALADIVRPDAAVITSIGHEHMEFFGTLENVAKEEFSVLRFVAEGGLAVVPEPQRLPQGFDARSAELSGTSRITPVIFENDAAVPDDLPLHGEHNRRNAAAAAAVGRWFGLDDATIRDALRHAEPVAGRFQPLRYGASGGVTVFNDAYNANPSSMHAALRTFAQIDVPPSGRRIAILGDMFELGAEAPTLHRQTAEVIAGLPEGAIALVITVGQLSMFTAEALRRVWPGERVHAVPMWSDDVPAQIAAMLRENDLVLLKGSRGMRLERLLPAIEARFA